MKTKLILSTSPEAPSHFLKLINLPGYVASFTNYKDEDKENLTQQSNLAFTHPIFRYKKPERTAKNGVTKPAETCYGVLSAVPLGKGSYGGVGSLVGVWKLVDNKWVYKNKEHTVVKTNYYAGVEADSSVVEISYVNEYDIGMWVTHMRFKYKPVTHGNTTFLIMGKQPGVSLKSLITTLKTNPNFLSVSEKLNITVNLLEALTSQLAKSIVFIKKINMGCIIHNDLKPDNILVDSDGSVRFIDFGLSTMEKEGPSNRLRGAPVYMDPELFNGIKRTEDVISDLASISLCISELWGETSRRKLKTKDDLKKANRSNQLVGLVEGIYGLTAKESERIQKIIISSTNLYSKDRPTHEAALSEFKDLLEKQLELTKRLQQIRHKEMQQLLDELKGEKIGIKSLKTYQLLSILRSEFAAELINLCTAKDKRGICLRLGLDLLQLNNDYLDGLNASANYFSCFSLDTLLLKRPGLKVEEVERLITLGTPVTADMVRYWLNLPLAAQDRLRWASICRLIYNKVPNADELFSQVDIKDPFKKVFYLNFLKRNDLTTTEEYNLHIIDQHFNNFINIVESVKKILTQYCSHTTYAREVLTLIDALNVQNDFIVTEELKLSHVECELKKLDEHFKKLNNRTSFEGMPKRDEAVAKLKNAIDHLRRDDFNLTMCFLAEQIKLLDYLDSRKEIIALNISNPLMVKQLCAELDDYYSIISNLRIDKPLLEFQINKLLAVIKLIDNISNDRAMKLFEDSKVLIEIRETPLEKFTLATANVLFEETLKKLNLMKSISFTMDYIIFRMTFKNKLALLCKHIHGSALKIIMDLNVDGLDRFNLRLKELNENVELASKELKDNPQKFEEFYQTFLSQIKEHPDVFEFCCKKFKEINKERLEAIKKFISIPQNDKISGYLNTSVFFKSAGGKNQAIQKKDESKSHEFF